MSKNNCFINYILLSTDNSFILKICIVWAGISVLWVKSAYTSHKFVISEAY